MSVLGLEMENSKQKFIMIKDQRQMIMRGKRTKRLRQSVHVSSTSSSGCSSGDKAENDHVYFSIPSPTSSDENSDQDMANCLIMLAQSGGDNSVKQETVEKFSSSRKFTETATTAKPGFYVYECKTCNRSFTSFQALGGHRASHKKPKGMTEEKKVVVPSINPEGQINEAERESNVQFNKTTSTSFSVHKSSQHNNIIKSKVHECSICGSEFSSGQALGGHMRRHRSIPTTNHNIIDHENEKPRNILQLDLNLPAPEDDHRDSKLPFIFTAPALVGCHY